MAKATKVARAFGREHKIPKEAFTDIKGKEFVNFGGLLAVAHAMGLEEVETTLIDFPRAENGQTAIFQARVIFKTPNGMHVFTGTGDANAKNVGAQIAPHFIRMAETRAIARALRFALNINVAAVEELDDNSIAAIKNEAASAPPKPNRRGMLERLQTVVGEKGWNPEQAKEFMQKNFNKTASKDLTNTEIEMMIEKLGG